MLELNLLDQILEKKAKAIEEESCAVPKIPKYTSKPKPKSPYSLKKESDGSVP